MPRPRYRDRHGVLRRRVTNRRVRRDYRLPRAHPAGCAHCAMVAAWRDQVAAERERAGGWRNETFRPATPFGEWLRIYYREQRAREAA